MPISLYPRIKETVNSADTDIDFFLGDVQSGKWAIETGLVRQGKRSKEDDIPYVTVSGKFSRRTNTGLVKHSGFIAIDIDDTPPAEVKNLVARDKYLYAAFTSISGNGCCLLFRINGAKHLESFLWLEEYLHNTYGLIVDTHCKDVSRPRYVSHDPEIILNRSASITPAKKVPPPKKVETVIFVQTDFEEIVAQAQRRGANLCESYHDWLRVGFALVDKFQEKGRDYFHVFSQQSGKYNPESTNRQYDNCLRAQGHGVTIGTLYHYAKQHNIECYSERTKQIAEVAVHARRRKSNEESALGILEKEGISRDEAAPIVQQVFESGATIQTSESPIDEMIGYIKANYSLKRNLVNRKIFNNGKVFEEPDMNSLYVHLKQVLPRDVTSEMIKKYIGSSEVESYNPIFDFIRDHEDYPCDGAIDDYISAFTTTNDAYFRKFFKIWYVSILYSAHGQKSPLMLVYNGPQNTGKTRAFRELLPVPLREYFANSSLDEEKDGKILMTQKLLILDDEYGGKNKRESKKLKNLSDADIFSLREPYGQTNVDLKRLAVLCGTTNDVEILNDPTGNRRIIPVTVLSIDFDAINQVDRTGMFIEAYKMFRAGFRVDLTNEDIRELNQDSVVYQEYSEEYELISKWFRKPRIGETGECLRQMDILQEISAKSGYNRLSKKRVGLEMVNMGFEVVSDTENGHPVKKYRVVRISEMTVVPGFGGAGTSVASAGGYSRMGDPFDAFGGGNPF